MCYNEGMSKFLFLILGGSLGTLCRYLISTGLPAFTGETLPYGTITANLLGCLILGLIMGVSEARLGEFGLLPQSMRLLLIVGFLGALTTFSSLEMETLILLQKGDAWKAFLNVIGSVTLGFVALWFSYSWSRWFFGHIKWN